MYVKGCIICSEVKQWHVFILVAKFVKASDPVTFIEHILAPIFYYLFHLFTLN